MDLKTNKIQKIFLTKTQETLLITLYAKALGNRSNRSILHDEAANELVSSIDFDFRKFESFGSNNNNVIFDNLLRLAGRDTKR